LILMEPVPNVTTDVLNVKKEPPNVPNVPTTEES
jgi:hypothetical protein